MRTCCGCKLDGDVRMFGATYGCSSFCAANYASIVTTITPSNKSSCKPRTRFYRGIKVSL